ncbi:MAG: penicillin-binding protein 2 [Verrucomicrobiales bacterium]|jgi:penicillin-binding protein 2
MPVAPGPKLSTDPKRTRTLSEAALNCPPLMGFLSNIRPIGIIAGLAIVIGLIAVNSGQQLLAQQEEPEVAPIFRTGDPIKPKPIDPTAPTEPGLPRPVPPEPRPGFEPLQPGLPPEEAGPTTRPPATPNLPQPKVPGYPERPPMTAPQTPPATEPDRVPVEALPPVTGAVLPPEEKASSTPEVAPEIAPPLPDLPEGPQTTGPGFAPSSTTVKGARILNLSIPAPRGQIVDRYGRALARNVVVYYLGLNFPHMGKAEDAEIIAYAKERLDTANEVLGRSLEIDDDDILDHYKSRRWLPLIFTNRPLTEEQRGKVAEAKFPGLILHPTYQRIYPEGKTASHILGYVGKRGPWPKGEIPDGEMMWPTAEGVRGLELWYDRELSGSPGRVQIIFDEKGDRVEETIIRSPVPGNNIVTSLDIDMQIMAERHLEEKAKRGAFVIMDVQSGDVLVMASYPWFDPNVYIPRVSTEMHNSLVNDPAKPMYGRAFQATYPPASTFKVSCALAMLEAGSVNEFTLYDCPTAFTIGNHIAHNWNKEPEGQMNVIGAITRSCNTWFYQAAIDTGSVPITAMGLKLGLGAKTGVPLPEEAKGIMPSNEWYRKHFGWQIMNGDLASIAIGQGAVETTPLQVCQMMGAIGNRQYFRQARLVLQLQDYSNRIVESYPVVDKYLNISPHNLAVVHRGMHDVVNAGNGTGQRVRHDRIKMTGKTGTGQWKPNLDQNVAWFAGFAPAEFPVYAYAALYEGDPGETVSGGRLAGPIVGEYFDEFLDDERLAELQATSGEIEIAHVAAGMILDEPLPTGSIFRKTGLEEVYDEPETTAPARPRRGLIQSLLGGRNKNRR